MPRMRTRRLFGTFVALVIVFVGGMLIYSGWQSKPGREEILASGLEWQPAVSFWSFGSEDDAATATNPRAAWSLRVGQIGSRRRCSAEARDRSAAAPCRYEGTVPNAW